MAVDRRFRRLGRLLRRQAVTFAQIKFSCSQKRNGRYPFNNLGNPKIRQPDLDQFLAQLGLVNRQ